VGEVAFGDSIAFKSRCAAFGGGAEFSAKKDLLIFCDSASLFAIFCVF
jgi:hypothetical protein